MLSLTVLYAQRGTGELRLRAVDSSGAGVEASGTLINQAIQLKLAFTTDSQGRYTARNLPFGVYHLSLDREGFGAVSRLLEIRSEVPFDYTVTLRVAPLETELVVNDSDTLIDPHHTAPSYRIGEEALSGRRASLPARAVLDLVEMEPGWLVEANGVLHPRGAEYNTQYIVDGFPVVDNRSPAYAPGVEADSIQSMNVRTAGYPAEYGRKLGGVIEVTTAEDTRPGWHGSAVFEGGSFSTTSGFASAQYARRGTVVGASVDAAHTARYLDPPVENNFTNKGSSGGASARLATGWSENSRLSMEVSRRRAGFLVPDERLQYEAGQRQDRANEETSGHISYQHALAPWLLASARGMARDLSASLWSNPESTPILSAQQRGFRETYLSGAISAHRGMHEMKAGAEAIWSSVHEDFEYHITSASFFPPDVPLDFQFSGRRRGSEESAFVQDLVRLGNWTLSGGIRWDGYRLLVRDSAASPRVAAAWYWPGAGIVLRASYDRAFEIPAVENLLLASSEAAQRLTNTGTGLAVRPSRGNFYEAGLSKAIAGRARLEASYFARRIRDFSDDDLLLNTGISFPVAFASAQIHGVEVKLEVPRWGPVSGFVSYSNMAGTGRLPITGGLFLENASDLLHSTARFAVTQDQRNTAHARARYQAGRRIWLAFGASYGSGLPVELEGGGDASQWIAQYGEQVVRRVNFARRRVRPSFSLDGSVGVDAWKHDRRTVRLQADVLNMTGRLNVINFAGLFSGTALAAPRSAAVRIVAAW